MATITKHLKGAANAPLAHIGGHKMVSENVLDFSLDGLDVAASDVVQALIMPDNAIVTSVLVEVLTVEGGVATLDIGNDSDDDGYLSAVDANALGGIIKASGALVTQGTRYNNLTTINIVPSADLDTAKVMVSAEYYIQELS